MRLPFGSHSSLHESGKSQNLNVLHDSPPKNERGSHATESLRSQPADSGVAHPVGRGDGRQRVALFVTPFNGLVPLMLCQLGRPAHVHATGLGPLPAFARARPDQVALKLRKPA